jgi:hypothetical protein
LNVLFHFNKKKKKKEKMDRIMRENRCWHCESELKPKDRVPYTYYCPNKDCDDGDWEYYSCFLCERENGGKPLSVDCDAISKGTRCEGCQRYLCLSCRCEYIGYLDEGDYYCEKCFHDLDADKKNRIINHEEWCKSFCNEAEKALWDKNKALLKSWINQ